MRKSKCGAILIFSMFGVLAFASNLKIGIAAGTIYIMADGSINPPSAPISTLDKTTYIFVGNVSGTVQVERSNIVVDGDGFTVDAAGSGYGIILTHSVNNVTVRDFRIRRCNYGGIWVDESFSNTIFNNTIIDCAGYGLYIDAMSHNNLFSGNILKGNNPDVYLAPWSYNSTMTGNTFNIGIYINNSPNNTFLHNSIGGIDVYGGYANIWDDGQTGNYWMGFNVTDTNHDGIGDTPYVINANNTDHYPLMVPYTGPVLPSSTGTGSGWWTWIVVVAVIVAVVGVAAFVLHKRKRPATITPAPAPTPQIPPPPPNTRVPKRKMIITAATVVSIIIIMAVIFFVVLPNLPASNAGLAGIYDSTDPAHSGGYIELRTDGTAYLYFSYPNIPGTNHGVYGNWELKDQNRIFLTTAQGAAGYLTIQGDTLTSDSGETYVRRK